MKSYPIQVLFRESFEGIVAAIFLALFLRFFVLSILYMPSQNMEPNLQKGDFVIGWRLAYGFPLPLMQGERLNFKAPKRGDLVSFRFPGDQEQIVIRRVVALAGDKLKIEKGVLFVNGEKISEANPEENLKQINESFTKTESYPIRHNPNTNLKELEVPEKQIFVLSDNRLKTDDSRDWGFVPMNHIESRLGFIWLSLKSESQDDLSINWDRIFHWVH